MIIILAKIGKPKIVKIHNQIRSPKVFSDHHLLSQLFAIRCCFLANYMLEWLQDNLGNNCDAKKWLGFIIKSVKSKNVF